MLYFSKESSTKDQHVKTQMMMTLSDDNDSQKTETIWKSNDFFKEQRTDSYLEFVILGQILPFANPDPKINLNNHDFKDNEVLLFVPSYNAETGLYQGVKKKLEYITLTGDVNQRFFSYGYNKENGKVLFCTVKQPIPNIFHSTAFMKHMSYFLDEN